jgi:carbonic anhydrase
VREKFDTGGLTIYGWIYDIELGTIEVFDEKTNEFVEI